MVAGILCLLYLTSPEMRYEHAVYRMLFYVPLVLGTFWFGLKGALYISSTVLLFYLPYLMGRWEGFSYRDFTSLLEMVIYFIVALLLGFLVERERRRERALRQAESLAAIGRTVSELAHDMKGPLIAIHGFANQISKRLESDHPDKEKLRMMIQEAACLESMVEEMLDFGRPFELHLAETNLNGLVKESIDVADEMARKTGVISRVDLDPSLPPLQLDPRRIKQALLNLIINAIQACSDGEDVLVRTRVSKNEVVLDVIDKGCGIKTEDTEVVFTPFFSTKRAGTGLGLAIVKKIVTAHGGKVSFCPNPGKGVTFTVRLPSEKK